jgi:HPt (histidine-containing phosphotransfer) domain-containing protein
MEQRRSDYALQLPNRVNETATAAEGLNTPDTDCEQNLLITHLQEYSHKLAGSSATFGFPKISGIARMLEQVTKSLLTQ